jgi:hypothetical protein
VGGGEEGVCTCVRVVEVGEAEEMGKGGIF